MCAKILSLNYPVLSPLPTILTQTATDLPILMGILIDGYHHLLDSAHPAIYAGGHRAHKQHGFQVIGMRLMIMRLGYKLFAFIFESLLYALYNHHTHIEIKSRWAQSPNQFQSKFSIRTWSINALSRTFSELSIENWMHPSCFLIVTIIFLTRVAMAGLLQ